MTEPKRTIEIFSADCPLCRDLVSEIRAAACPSCRIEVRDMADAAVRRRAADLGVASVPAVAIDGALADCCSGRGVDIETLRAAGLGRS